MGNGAITYYSTNHRAPEATFREALLKGLAPDGGLYIPSSIPRLDTGEMESFSSLSYPEIAHCVLRKFLLNEVSDDVLAEMCRQAYYFPVPVEKVSGNSYIMRLDQGPSASFKDFAARMMARLMDHFVSAGKQHITILTATSGDTGSAVAGAFHKLENINVVILFPYGEVTEIQRKQMTTVGDNISTIALNGKFDDCQSVVKQAFTDTSLSGLNLTSANSINIGRLLPQSVYYFYAFSRIARQKEDQIIFSVPSGNYGNLSGAIIAREMGLPVSRLLVASNSNNSVPEYLRTGRYKKIAPSINCISNAMNVGHPSNLARIIALYGGIMDDQGSISKAPDLKRMQRDFYASEVSDDETRATIADCYNKYGCLLEPHGAVAWKCMERFIDTSADTLNKSNISLVSLETAHPGKFGREIKSILGFQAELPISLKEISGKNENFKHLENNYVDLKEYLRKQFKSQ